MIRELIKTDGTVTLLLHALSVREASAMIGAEFVDTVNLGGGRVMLVNDIGISLGLPVNVKATNLYHSVCARGTTHQILGDVLVVPDADYGDDDEHAPA